MALDAEQVRQAIEQMQVRLKAAEDKDAAAAQIREQDQRTHQAVAQRLIEVERIAAEEIRTLNEKIIAQKARGNSC